MTERAKPSEQRICNQQGGVIIVTVTLLLVIASLMTVYTARIQSFEHQILLNQINRKLALLSAEAGMQQAAAALMQGRDISALDGLTNSAHYTVVATQESVALDIGQGKLITLTSQSDSPDKLANAQITQQWLITSLLINLPPAPLMVSGGIKDKLSLHLVTNPEGKGIGQPLSVWSNEDLDWEPSNSMSCYPDDYRLGLCLDRALSAGPDLASDIEQGAASYPNNLFGYLFNLESADVLTRFTGGKVAGCEDLAPATTQVIWVVGECRLNALQQLGSVSQPILLIVEDGDVFLSDAARFYGLLLSYQSEGAALPTVDMHSTALIEGALLSNHSLGEQSAYIHLLYNLAVLTNLAQHNGLQLVASVPGSWRDF